MNVTNIYLIGACLDPWRSYLYLTGFFSRVLIFSQTPVHVIGIRFIFGDKQDLCVRCSETSILTQHKFLFYQVHLF